MLTPDRQVGLVFNGAIYNFLPLRAELERLGYEFQSRTDTEVILNGYLAWGAEELIGRLRGMFAFCIWDERQQVLHLVRDRLGVKPLYYCQHGEELAFASTAAAVRHFPYSGDIDELAVLEYLEFGFITEERSIYENVRKVPPAHWLEFRNGQIESRQYWRHTTPSRGAAPKFAEAVEETERLLLEAVELRLQGDVPVGSMLSGGVDSGLVCWAVAKLGGDITAFTIATPGDPGDESADAIATARQIGIRHKVLTMSAGDFPGIDVMVAAYGEPFACSSALGVLRVAKAVAPEATILLTGDGGDDVFLGYPIHRRLLLSQSIARGVPSPGASALQAVSKALPRRGLLKRAANFLDYASGGLGALTSIHDGLPYYWKHNLLGERIRGAQLPQRQIERSVESARNALAEWLEYIYQNQFVGEYMTKVDGGTMYYAMESRSPFLDQVMWEYAGALPYSLRLRQGALKAVLREIARRRIGERVATGRKRGFTIPVDRWIPGRWQAMVREAFSDSVLAREGLVRADAVLRQLDAAVSAQRAPHQLWYLFLLECWRRRSVYGEIGLAASPAVSQA